MTPKENLIRRKFSVKKQLDAFLTSNGIMPPKVGGYAARLALLESKSYKQVVSMVDKYCNK